VHWRSDGVFRLHYLCGLRVEVSQADASHGVPTRHFHVLRSSGASGLVVVWDLLRPCARDPGGRLRCRDLYASVRLRFFVPNRAPGVTAMVTDPAQVDEGQRGRTFSFSQAAVANQFPIEAAPTSSIVRSFAEGRELARQLLPAHRQPARLPLLCVGAVALSRLSGRAAGAQWAERVDKRCKEGAPNPLRPGGLYTSSPRRKVSTARRAQCCCPSERCWLGRGPYKELLTDGRLVDYEAGAAGPAEVLDCAVERCVVGPCRCGESHRGCHAAYLEPCTLRLVPLSCTFTLNWSWAMDWIPCVQVSQTGL